MPLKLTSHVHAIVLLLLLFYFTKLLPKSANANAAAADSSSLPNACRSVCSSPGPACPLDRYPDSACVCVACTTASSHLLDCLINRFGLCKAVTTTPPPTEATSGSTHATGSSPVNSTSSSTSGSLTGFTPAAIAGIAIVGACVGAAIIAAAVCLLLRRRHATIRSCCRRWCPLCRGDPGGVCVTCSKDIRCCVCGQIRSDLAAGVSDEAGAAGAAVKKPLMMQTVVNGNRAGADRGDDDGGDIEISVPGEQYSMG